MYQDTYIEYWGEIFVSARIIEFGITFERFLKDPWKHLKSCGQESAPDAIAEGMLPLLPAQAEVATGRDRTLLMKFEQADRL